MYYKASTSLKKADTEGRVPQHTLDQYVRSELSSQLIKALTPHLPISRLDQSGHTANQNTVDFTAELVCLEPNQWQRLKESLNGYLNLLPTAQQLVIRQLIAEVDRE